MLFERNRQTQERVEVDEDTVWGGGREREVGYLCWVWRKAVF